MSRWCQGRLILMKVAKNVFFGGWIKHRVRVELLELGSWIGKTEYKVSRMKQWTSLQKSLRSSKIINATSQWFQTFIADACFLKWRVAGKAEKKYLHWVVTRRVYTSDKAPLRHWYDNSLCHRSWVCRRINEAWLDLGVDQISNPTLQCVRTFQCVHVCNQEWLGGASCQVREWLKDGIRHAKQSPSV